MMLTQEEISELVRSVWTSVLGLELSPTASVSAHAAGERFFTGCIQITGSWEGAVTLDCSQTLARKAAALMFGMEPDAPTDEEIRDALGELTNVVGGNFKNRLPGPCQLSLPSVAEGVQYKFTIPGGKLLSQAAFDCEGQSFLVCVLARNLNGTGQSR